MDPSTHRCLCACGSYDSPASMANIHWLQGAHECPMSESECWNERPPAGSRRQGQGAEVGAKSGGSGLCHPSVSLTWGGGMGKEAGEPEEGHSLKAGGLAEGGNLG